MSVLGSTAAANLPTSGSQTGPQLRTHPCVLCQQRKVRCDRNFPCANCKKARAECVSPTTLPPKKRKKRFPEAELLARLRRYEEHLKKYGADIDSINQSASSPPETLKLESVSPSSVKASGKHFDHNIWTGTNTEFRDAEEILEGSSEDEEFAKPFSRTWDTIPADGGDVLFAHHQAANLPELHPQPVQIFRLWQTFLDNVNPLTKILHAPSVQQQVLDATTHLHHLPSGMEALMFGMYACSVASMNEEECKAVFHEEKPALRSRYHTGARQALLRAEFLRSSELIVLQAFVLYLLSSLHFVIDPRSLFCLTGVALRIAQRMGINVDGTAHGLPPFETEMRRRLWWQIILLDNRVGELSGAGSTFLTHVWSTRLPMNLNDSDLFPDMRAPPVEHKAVTEMIFVLQRCEVADFLRRVKDLPPADTAALEAAVDEFENRLQEKYLQRCDLQIPLHLVSTLVAKSRLCKLRMGRRHEQSGDKDKYFLLSLTMLELHNQMMESPSLKNFRWHIHTTLPFPAYVYLLGVLRHRTSDALADRAWQILSQIFDRRMSEFARKKKNVLHLAMANLTIKAWEAREFANPQYQRGVPPPMFITHLRSELASRQSKRSKAHPVASDVLMRSSDGGGPVEKGMFSSEWFGQNASGGNNGQIPDQTLALPGFNSGDTSLISMEWEFWNDFMDGTGGHQGLLDGSIAGQSNAR